MKMLTKENRNKIPKLYSTDGQGENAVAQVKFFAPWTNWTWYVIEANLVLSVNGGDDYVELGLKAGSKLGLNEIGDSSQQESGKWVVEDILMFGLVDGHEKELGSFSYKELLSIKGPWGLKIERDRYFEPKAIKDLTNFD